MIIIDYSKYKVGICTLGCKVNQYESNAITEAFEKLGFKVGAFSEMCEIYVVNTCTVTMESDRKARQMIRRAIHKNPNAYILVTGCYSQTQPGKISKIDGVDFIGGNTNKMEVVTHTLNMIENQKPILPFISVGDLSNCKFEPMAIHHSERTRAYVKIEDGCESNCTYCIIPEARGKIRSKLPNDVINEVKVLVDNGYKEVVLTGIETASYGIDFGNYRLNNLLYEIDKIDGLDRIRLGSLDPSLIKPTFTDKLVDIRKLVPHYHISIQSGCDKILNLMKRKYNTKMVLEYISYMREKIPNVTFTTDIMTGFPNETEEDFEQSLRFIKNIEFLNMHIFTYSKRPYTLAASMNTQVPEEIKIKRAEILNNAQHTIKSKIINNFILGKAVFPVLFESYENGYARGHTPNFLEISIKSDTDLHGQIKDIELVYFDGMKIYGECNNGF